MFNESLDLRSFDIAKGLIFERGFGNGIIFNIDTLELIDPIPSSEVKTRRRENGKYYLCRDAAAQSFFGSVSLFFAVLATSRDSI